MYFVIYYVQRGGPGLIRQNGSHQPSSLSLSIIHLPTGMLHSCVWSPVSLPTLTQKLPTRQHNASLQCFYESSFLPPKDVRAPRVTLPLSPSSTFLFKITPLSTNQNGFSYIICSRRERKSLRKSKGLDPQYYALTLVCEMLKK